MPDITMCKGGKCPLRKTCYRFNAPLSAFRQSYFVTPPYNKDAKGCSSYWPTEGEK